MPKIAAELSPGQVGRLREDGDHAVGVIPGLYLQVMGASRVWILRYVLGDRRRRMGLGPFPAVTLAQARELARAARAQIDQGVDPIGQRQLVQRTATAARSKALTFQQASDRFLAMREAEWRNAKHRQQWVNTLEQYALPTLGALDVAGIDHHQVMAVLQPIWRSKTSTASRLRGRIEQVLDWATANGHRHGVNPARWRGHLDQLLPRPSKIAKVVHHEAVPVAEAPLVVGRIADAAGMGAQALLLQILTAARSGEVRGAVWSEFDLEARIWSIPAKRMKGNLPHRVPLSQQALDLVKKIPRIEDLELVFPSRRNTALSDMTLTAVMRRMKLQAVPHGFRSTFRDWAAECTTYPSDVVEMALAHVIASKVEAAYRRGDMLARRATLMQEWADYCLPRPAT